MNDNNENKICSCMPLDLFLSGPESIEDLDKVGVSNNGDTSFFSEEDSDIVE